MNLLPLLVLWSVPTGLAQDAPDLFVERSDDSRRARRLRSKLATWHAAGEPPGRGAGRRLSQLADEAYDAGEFSEAATLFEQSFEVLEGVLGESHVQLAAPLSGQAGALWELGEFDQASQMHDRALSIREAGLGPEHPDLAINLNGLARIKQDLGDFDGARPLFERALALRERALKPNHPDIASSLTSLAYLELTTGNAPAALPLAQRALAIRRQSLGEDDAHTGTALDFLARVYQSLGDYDRARPLYEQALEVRERALGPDHPYVSITLNNLARLRYELGELEQAERLFRRATEADERTYGPDNPALAGTLDNLGTVVWAQGDLDEALALFHRALSIREAALGSDHYEVATTLSSLAVVYRSRGDYAAARVAAERAVEIDRAALGAEHPYTLAAMNNLAVLLHHQGDAPAARALYEQVLAISEARLGSDHPDVLVMLHNLATSVASSGDHAEALALYGRVLALEEAALGEDNLDVATTLDHMAQQLIRLSRFDRATSLLERSLGIRAGAIGEHADMAITHRALAEVARARGEVEVALRHTREALAIQERTLGATHPLMTDSLLQLSVIHTDMGERQRARDHLTRALAIAETGLSLLDTLAEREALELSAKSRETFDAWLGSFDGPGDVAAAYDGVRRWKGAATRRLLARRRAASGAQGPLEVELRNTRARIAELFLDSTSDVDVKRDEVLELTRRKERLEREIASAQPARSAADTGQTAAALCAALPDAAALVDFLRYVKRGEPHYVAFVLRSGSCALERIELGEAETIDEAILQWRRHFLSRNATSRSAPLVPTSPPADRGVLARDLNKLLWVPLGPYLRGVGRLYLVPDGPLASFPFAALEVGGGRLLVESTTLSTLDHAHDLLATAGPSGSGLLIVGDVAYDSLGEAPEDGDRGGRRAACVERDFTPLPGTAREAAELSALWQSLERSGSPRTLKGDAATEAEVARAMVGQEIVHLATHGFFGAGSCAAETGAGQLAGFNPMVLSGLALAGANQTGDRLRGDDGILTAEEVASLDLRGTRMVVLSACETGLGEIASGEGVLGLRRAFAHAGVATQVSSLWAVPDEATSQLMGDLYRGLLEEGRPPAEALRDAQLALLRDARASGSGAGVETWAAFVLTGR